MLPQRTNYSCVLSCFFLIITIVPNMYAEPNWIRIDIADPPPRMEAHNMVYDASNECAFLFGGIRYKQRDYPVFLYEGTQWIAVEPFGDWPQGRTDFGMAYDSNREVVVIFGGFVGGPDYLGDTWEWDGTQWQQFFPEPRPSDRYGCSMIYDSKLGKVVLFGGYDDDHEVKGDTWAWDGNEWIRK